MSKINFDYYSGEDIYSDGAIEDEILNIVKNNIYFNEIIKNDNRWPILYHLSPHRRNLLEWYQFSKGSSILEIGAGCGALTGLFCEKLKKVVAVELSKKRAEIIAERYKNVTNLEIIVGNLNDIQFFEHFDYITLIGVLEYAGKYTDEQHPYLSFLKKVKGLLKKEGTLLIALENKFGLKYWGGYREDHSGKLFQGIEGYVDSKDIVTFSKDELKELLFNAGFKDINYYYPMPDYKIPHQIFSDEFLPRLGQIDENFPNFDQERLKLFNEKLVYNNLILDKKFDFFANSFLIFCKLGD